MKPCPFAISRKSFFNRPSEVSRTDVVTTHIAALEGAFDYDGASDALAVHQLGLGSETSKVTRDGVTLLGIDVNASVGRHVDVRVTADPQQVLRLDIAPSFQLDLEYKMASVNPLVQNLETFVLDDTLTIQAEGAQGLKLLESTVGSVALIKNATGYLLGLSTGRLTMTSRTMPGDNVTVEPGRCLFRSMPPFAAGHHEFLRELSARDCP